MEYILDMQNISKTFPGVKALDNVQLHVRPGEVHAMMGEKGAGKSTLMKILMGIYSMDDGGSITFDGKPYHVHNPREAMPPLRSVRSSRLLVSTTPCCLSR